MEKKCEVERVIVEREISFIRGDGCRQCCGYRFEGTVLRKKRLAATHQDHRTVVAVVVKCL